MAARKTSKKSAKGATGATGFQFLIDYMKAHPKAVYAEAKEAADRAGHKIFPIVWGRAQALLGRVKSKPRKARAEATAGTTGKRRGRPPGSKNKPKTGAAPTGKRRGRPPGSKNKVARAGTTRNGAIPIEIRDSSDLARWSEVVNALNRGGKVSLHFDGSNWSLGVH